MRCSAMTMSLLALVFSITAHAQSGEQRIALVIGNARYQFAGELKNPVNDADDMASALKAYGFSVTLIKDCTKKRMMDALADFGGTLCPDGVALFYYAGHGGQHQGDAYLIPVDARLAVEGDMPYECVNAGQVLTKMEAAETKVNIMILDACRNNPFSRNWARSSGQQGLAEIKMVPKGSIISYAADANQTADENPSERNGLYTKYLLENIRNPDLELRDVFMNTRIAVAHATGDRQMPAEYSKLMGHFYFSRLPDASLTSNLTVKPSPVFSSSSAVGSMQVAVNAPSAQVLVDGVFKGVATRETPLTLEEVLTGKVTVKVEAEDYIPLIRAVNIEENTMKKEFFELPGAVASRSGRKAAPGPKMYTAYNMWFESPVKMFSTNYKKGALIPAGTEVTDIKVSGGRSPSITFKRVQENITCRVYFIPKHHPGLTVKQYASRMFTAQTFEEITQALTEEEIEAIKAGEIVPGMNRWAVIMAYGYPPEHRTSSLSSRQWVSWHDRFRSKTIVFDENGRTVIEENEAK